MEYKNYYGMIEAVLFASGEPVSLERMAQALNLDEKTLSSMMKDFIDQYQTAQRGIQAVELEGSYQLCTKPEHERSVKCVLELKKNTPLSQAALEVLAIIAYNEPVTKSFIEQVRGVDSSQIVNNLVEKGLIEEAGRMEVPGRPISYRTSSNFLRSFGMRSLGELPPLPDDDNQVKLEEVVSGGSENH